VKENFLKLKYPKSTNTFQTTNFLAIKLSLEVALQLYEKQDLESLEWFLLSPITKYFPSGILYIFVLFFALVFQAFSSFKYVSFNLVNSSSHNFLRYTSHSSILTLSPGIQITLLIKNSFTSSTSGLKTITSHLETF